MWWHDVGVGVGLSGWLLIAVAVAAFWGAALLALLALFRLASRSDNHECRNRSQNGRWADASPPKTWSKRHG